MHPPEWAILVLRSPLFLQIAPLITLILIPTVVFLTVQHIRRLSFDRLLFSWFHTVRMGLESLGFSIPWLWSSSSSQYASSSSSHGKRHKKKSNGSTSKSKVVRTRAEQIAMNEIGKPNESNIQVDSELEETGYYPGLVNISGTYCFMNSTLQALASLSYLQPYINAIHTKAEALDVPTPVIDALQELFTNLNTPKSSYHSLRPHDIISVLSAPQPPPPGFQGTYHLSTASPLFTSREHQDAQELFQLVSECIKNEMNAVEREGLKDRGIAGVLEFSKANDMVKREESDRSKEDMSVVSRSSNNKSVFDGLTANRRSCVVCGYTEAVMHFGFDNWQLAMPRAASCHLEDCLEDYTRLEILKDCICRKCSVLATHRRLSEELKTLEDALGLSSGTPSTASSTVFSSSSSVASSSLMPSSSPTRSKPSTSKRKRHKEVKKMVDQVKTAITEGRIEDEALLKGVRLEKVVSPASTKQAMIARPPPVLVLHLNRSVHYGQYASKNTINVKFPEVLDLTPYTTSGSLSISPMMSISTPPPPPKSHALSSQSSASSDVSSQPRRPTTPTPETYAPGAQRTIYRLAAVVCHYGQHSFGHYICYRRKPKRMGGKWVPPTLVDPLRLEMEEDEDTDVGDGSEKNSKPNGNAKRPNYAGSSTCGETRYYWEDRTEEDMGTGRGWLRISDDSVSECGIESVLAEGSGAFMLYYEKAVHPPLGIYLRGRGNGAEEEASSMMNGSRTGRSRSRSAKLGMREIDCESLADTDTDNFSIGSEETLKPEMKVIDLNGSMGSLVSEVGVGIMKSQKKPKTKVERSKHTAKEVAASPTSQSTHLPLSSASSASSTSFGPRVVRSINARRRNIPKESDSMAITSPAPMSNGIHATTNGTAVHVQNGVSDDTIPSHMTASAPSILSKENLAKATANGNVKKHTSSPLGIGSKSTKIMHHPAPASSASGVQVKAR